MWLCLRFCRVTCLLSHLTVRWIQSEHAARYNKTGVFFVPVCQPIKGKCDEFPVPFRFGFAGWIPQSAQLLRACTVLHYPQRHWPPVWASRTQPKSHLLKQGEIFRLTIRNLPNISGLKLNRPSVPFIKEGMLLKLHWDQSATAICSVQIIF